MATVDESVPKPPPGRHLTARAAVGVMAIAVVLLVLFEGASLRDAGEEMDPGVQRDVVLAVGHPAGWVADQLPFDELAAKATDWIGEQDDVGDAGSFDDASVGRTRGGAPAAITPDAFDAEALGAKPAPPPRELDTLLVTGDSMSMPLDVEVARRLADDGVKVLRDPHLGTGISKSGFLDWGKLSTTQTAKDEPDATVLFIGANEGFDMPAAGGSVRCCGPAWAAAYANRVRAMMNTYRQQGAARVYWLTLPLPRDGARQEVARAVNAAIEAAAAPYRAQVRVLDMEALFTPDERYRAAMTVDGEKRIVREPDGIHLNGAGAELAAERVLDAVRRDFGG